MKSLTTFSQRIVVINLPYKPERRTSTPRRRSAEWRSAALARGKECRPPRLAIEAECYSALPASNDDFRQDQRRAHNDLNQITALSTANTAWDSETTPLASDKTHHDANGNQLLLPTEPMATGANP